MYEIKKTFEISAAHKLDLSYQSKCNRRHGHNYFVTVYCRSEELGTNGMVTDFSLIKKLVDDILDHRDINDILAINPTTAEHIAHWIYMQVPKCYRVDVRESRDNIASYFEDTPQFISSPL